MNAARINGICLMVTAQSTEANTGNKIMDTVRRLRSLGFVIEMVGFGSGYSSLNMCAMIVYDYF